MHSLISATGGLRVILLWLTAAIDIYIYIYQFAGTILHRLGERQTLLIDSGSHAMAIVKIVFTRRLNDDYFFLANVLIPNANMVISFRTGELHNVPVKQLQAHVRKHYGTLAKFPGLFGKRDMLMSCDPKIYEIVYRTEGVWPVRRGLETFDYYRKHVRPDVFGGIGGLIFDQGETWASMRQAVGPVLLKPKVVKSYVPVVDQVTREFVAKVHAMRDANSEMPADFANEMGLWATESIGAIALDRRMGVLERDRNEEADLLIKVNIKNSVKGDISIIIKK